MSKPKIRGTLTFRLVLLIFRQLLITSLFIIALGFLLVWLNEMNITAKRIHPAFIILGIFVISLMLSTTVSFFISRIFLKPIRQISQATKKIADGDFSVRITYDEQNEIGELVHNFNLMVEDLKNIEMLKDSFISTVSHEFKTPLSAISGYSALLQDENLSTEERRLYTQNIIDSAKKLNELTSNVLRLSKLENGETKIEKTSYSLDEQVRQAILTLEKEWNDKNIDLDIDLDECDCVSYKQLNEHIWINIIANAVKFSDYGGKVEISLKKSGHTAQFKVKDYGVGMRPETQKRIFDKFYQGDESHGKEGNGLGLALVKKLIQISGFEISVDSVFGEGSTFTVTVPLSA